MNKTRQPVIILAEPQLGENIGASARAMLNFGLTELRIAAPRDGWPNPAAEPLAAGAFEAGVNVTAFDSVEAACADLGYLVAATARPRGMEKPVTNAGGAVDLLKAQARPTGVLFGNEAQGLSNDHVALCDAIMTYPVNKAFASLTLSQAVIVFAHAWGEALGDAEGPVPGAPMERRKTSIAYLSRVLSSLESQCALQVDHEPQLAQHESLPQGLHALVSIFAGLQSLK